MYCIGITIYLRFNDNNVISGLTLDDQRNIIADDFTLQTRFQELFQFNWPPPEHAMIVNEIPPIVVVPLLLRLCNGEMINEDQVTENHVSTRNDTT